MQLRIPSGSSPPMGPLTAQSRPVSGQSSPSSQLRTSIRPVSSPTRQNISYSQDLRLDLIGSGRRSRVEGGDLRSGLRWESRVDGARSAERIHEAFRVAHEVNNGLAFASPS